MPYPYANLNKILFLRIRMVNFKEASHYKRLNEKRVRCVLCPHDCVVGNGEVGVCKVRMNIHGKLKAMNYGKPHTVRVERVESFPLWHFLPGNKSLVVGAGGGNLESRWNQNPHYGKGFDEIPSINQDAMAIVKQAERDRLGMISFKDGEPGMFFEFVRDISSNSKRLKPAMISNGYLESGPARELSKKIDAVVFDVPSMNENFFEKILKGNLDFVLRTIKIFHDSGTWVEIKMTVIPEFHESLYDIRKLVSWILNNLDVNVPLHFVGYDDGEYRTPSDLLERAMKVAKSAGLNYVYAHGGEIKEGEITFCPNCTKPLVYRNTEKGFNFIKDGKCVCGKEIAGVWQ